MIENFNDWCYLDQPESLADIDIPADLSYVQSRARFQCPLPGSRLQMPL